MQSNPKKLNCMEPIELSFEQKEENNTESEEKQGKFNSPFGQDSFNVQASLCSEKLGNFLESTSVEKLKESLQRGKSIKRANSPFRWVALAMGCMAWLTYRLRLYHVYAFYDYILDEDGLGFTKNEYNLFIGLPFLVGPLVWCLTIRWLGKISTTNSLIIFQVLSTLGYGVFAISVFYKHKISMFACRCWLGFCNYYLEPNINGLINEWFRESGRVVYATTILNLHGSIGLIIPLVVFVYTTYFNTQLIICACNVLCVSTTFYYVYFVNKWEKQLPTYMQTHSQNTKTNPLTKIREIMSPKICAIIFTITSFYGVIGIFRAYGPKILADRGVLTINQSKQMLAICLFLNVGLMAMSGVIVDSISKKFLAFAFMCMFFYPCFYICFYLDFGIYGTIATLSVLYSISNTASSGIGWTLINFIVDEASLPIASAIQTIIGYMLYALFPFLFTLIVDEGGTDAACGFVTIIGFFMIITCIYFQYTVKCRVNDTTKSLHIETVNIKEILTELQEHWEELKFLEGKDPQVTNILKKISLQNIPEQIYD